MPEKNLKIKVSVDKSHLFTLGEKMYRESIEFVRELVTNAYDADASDVHVLITDDKITVEDNGSGMTDKGLEQFFTIGSEEKRSHSRSPKFGRRRIGQFGIGKFSALALADQFIIESIKGNYKYSVIFDSTDWMDSGSWELPITKEPKNALEQEGTKIILNCLKKKISLNETEKYLRQSVPLRAKKFNVYLNNKRITAKTIADKIFPVKANTMYGLIEGEIIVALSAVDVDEPGVGAGSNKSLFGAVFSGLTKNTLKGKTGLPALLMRIFCPSSHPVRTSSSIPRNLSFSGSSWRHSWIKYSRI